MSNSMQAFEFAKQEMLTALTRILIQIDEPGECPLDPRRRCEGTHQLSLLTGKPTRN